MLIDRLFTVMTMKEQCSIEFIFSNYRENKMRTDVHSNITQKRSIFHQYFLFFDEYFNL